MYFISRNMQVERAIISSKADFQLSKNRLTEFGANLTKWLGTLSVATLLVLAADHQAAPYSPIIGGRDRSESPIGRMMYFIALQYQDYWLDQGIVPDKEKFLNRLVHISPRLWQTLDAPKYLREYLNDEFILPLPAGTQFTEEFVRKEIAEIPEWFSPAVLAVSYTDSRNQQIEVATVALSETTKFAPVFAPDRIGSLTAPTQHLAWPDGSTADANTFALGSEAARAHGNGTAFSIEIAPDFILTIGSGWHGSSPLFPYPDVSSGVSLRYGKVVPNDDAAPATGLYSWDSDGEMRTLNQLLGNMYDSDYPPTAMLLQGGSVQLLKGAELVPYLTGELAPSDGVLVQVAYGISHAEHIPLLNQYLSSDAPSKKDALINTFSDLISSDELPGLDVVWMTVVKFEDASGLQKTMLSFALNAPEESENTTGNFKVAASMQEILKAIEASGKDDVRIISAVTIHTGAQGSTGNVIFSKGTTLPPAGTKSYATVAELVADKTAQGQVKVASNWGSRLFRTEFE